MSVAALEVEHFAHALAIGLEQHRESWRSASHGQQIGRALALLPERRRACRAVVAAAAARAPAASRNFAAKSEVLPSWRSTRSFNSAARGQQPFGFQRLIAFGQADDEAVVGPHGLDFDAALGAQPRGDGHAPRRMHAAAERGEHADAPIAQLVAAALDHDVAIARNAAGGGGLLFQVAQQIFGGVADRGCAPPSAACRRPAAAVASSSRVICADLAAELRGPPGGVAVPERHLAGLAGRGRNQSRDRA